MTCGLERLRPFFSQRFHMGHMLGGRSELVTVHDFYAWVCFLAASTYSYKNSLQLHFLFSRAGATLAMVPSNVFHEIAHGVELNTQCGRLMSFHAATQDAMQLRSGDGCPNKVRRFCRDLYSFCGNRARVYTKKAGVPRTPPFFSAGERSK